MSTRESSGQPGDLLTIARGHAMRVHAALFSLWSWGFVTDRVGEAADRSD